MLYPQQTAMAYEFIRCCVCETITQLGTGLNNNSELVIHRSARQEIHETVAADEKEAKRRMFGFISSRVEKILAQRFGRKIDPRSGILEVMKREIQKQLPEGAAVDITRCEDGTISFDIRLPDQGVRLERTDICDFGGRRGAWVAIERKTLFDPTPRNAPAGDPAGSRGGGSESASDPDDL